MLILNPQGLGEEIQRKLVNKIKGFFPFEKGSHRLELDDIVVQDPQNIDDIEGQTRAKRLGRSWASSVYGNLTLKDTSSGKVVDKAKVKLAVIPGFTRLYSFIISGSERQVEHLWRRKAGVYTSITNSGIPETQFNLAQGFNRRGFSLLLDTSNKEFELKYQTSSVPLYSVLNLLGAQDSDLKKLWGEEVLAGSKLKSKPWADGKKLLTALGREVPDTLEGVKAAIDNVFKEAQVREDTTEITLGKGFTTVTPDCLALASKKLLGVHRGDMPPDDRDATPFKELWGVDDLLEDRLERSRTTINRRVTNVLGLRDNIRSIISSDVFTGPILAFFTTTSVSSTTPQINPINWVSRYTGTTIVGQDVGGITDAFAVTDEAKSVHPSQLGVLDPVHTPEGEKSGISLQLALGVEREGKEVRIPVYNTRSKKNEVVSAAVLSRSVVSFPDQYTRKGQDMVPVTKKVTAQTPTQGKDTVNPKDVDYVLASPAMMFSPATNLVPFIQNNDGTRLEMAARQMEQAIPLKYREQPLIQVQATSGDAPKTWEQAWGAIAGHMAPIDGKVTEVSKTKIKLRTPAGKDIEIPLYNNYPLNGVSSFLDSTPLVKVGDTIKRGQPLADTIFTKDGVLSLGVNARVAYLPYKGLVFEDGTIVSESTAKRLTSEHLHKANLFAEGDYVNNKKKYSILYPGRVSKANLDKLDDRGVIKLGETVNPGETIIAAAKKVEMTPEKAMLRGIHKSLVSDYADKSVKWESEYSGKVVDINTQGKSTTVYVRTEEPIKAGDKITFRHGNKGIISFVLPDDEMPVDKDGNPVEIIVNPMGVPGRMNDGQVLETALSHVAEYEGSPIAVRNFEPIKERRLVKVRGHWRTITADSGATKEVWVEPYEYERDYLTMVQEELKARGLSSTTTLYDPKTKRPIGDILVGKQYVLKLQHQVDKKWAARSWGAGYQYTLDNEPRGGGKHGAQRLGELGLYGLLAHGAVHNLREMQTFKSDAAADAIWMAIQTGQPLPAVQVPSAYNKFIGLLRGLGLDVERRGDSLILFPMTDEEILEMSSGELEDPAKMIRAKDLRPEKGGLFDPEMTGGMNGRKFSHFSLSEAFPNPVFERAIRSLLGITQNTYNQLISGDVGVTNKGEIVSGEVADVVGPRSFEVLLSKINPKEDLVRTRELLSRARGDNLDKLNKKTKYLKALADSGLDANVYMLKHVLVVPPAFRPLSALEDGNLNRGDINQLYRELSLSNSQLRDLPAEMPEEQKRALRKEVYDGLTAITGLTEANPKFKGILNIIAGSNPKTGFFMEKLLKRRQDLTTRGVIVPDQQLMLDEIGVPEHMAFEMLRPFIMQKLVLNGMTPLAAREAAIARNPSARAAIAQVLEERPLLMKRDPVLHKYGIQAFKAHLVPDRAIHIHPLVTGGFNADFDGDQVVLFTPVTQEAVQEAWKLLPSRNLLNPATGAVLFTPSKEATLGLHYLTRMKNPSNILAKYSSLESAIADAENKKVPWDAAVTINGQKTTVGREYLKSKLPEFARGLVPSTDSGYFTNKELEKALLQVAKVNPREFPAVAQILKDAGFQHAYNVGFSLTLEDFKPLVEVRNSVLRKVEPEIAKVRSSKLPKAAQDAKIIEIYTKAGDEMEVLAKKRLQDTDNPLYTMSLIGGKPGWGQIKQLLLARMLVTDPSGRTVPAAVTSAYGDGLTLHDYWVSAAGVRKGIISKVQEVRDPGALSKRLMKSTMDILATDDDCSTGNGISLSVDDSSIMNRFTAKSITTKLGVIPAGTQVTPDVVAKLKLSKQTNLVVRSPLRCNSASGVCRKCFGGIAGDDLVKPGTNLGVLASSALGERAVQLALRVFHMSGTVGSGGLMDSIERLNQIVNIPQSIPMEATLATTTGKVKSIAKNSVGGWDIDIGGESHWVPQNRPPIIKVGDTVEKGQKISEGLVNPRTLLEQTNINTVQNYLVGELEDLYKAYNIDRRHYETIVKALTDTVVIEDSGDNEDIVVGDYARASALRAWNSSNPKAKPVKFKYIMRGTTTLPLDVQEDWIARLAYKHIRLNLQEAAALQQESKIHGPSPIPGLVYGAEFGKGKGGGY